MHQALTNGGYDVAGVRADFPALAMKVYDKPLVYLDNAASAQKPQSVLDRLTQAYTSEYANVHRGLHYLANAATEGYEGAREKVRSFLNAAPRSAASASSRATKSCSRSWSTTPTSCLGISCASATVPCSSGRRSTTRAISSSTSSRSS
jgi:cysteine desulfurase/selenocysteine lyase